MTKVYRRVAAIIAVIAVSVITLYIISYTPVDDSTDTATAQVIAAPAAPNIVIIIADDLGWNDIGPYGNRSVHTPNIDNLAANGLRFDNVFLTTSSCSASRASILTGKYPHSNGLVHLHQGLPASESTLGLLLAQGGYHTESVGKWHLGGESKSQFSSVIESRTDSGTERWLERLRQRPVDVPFFFWLASHDPHRPYTVSDNSAPYTYHSDSIEVPSGFVDGPGTREEFTRYYREVSRFDRDVGSVISELEAQNVLENTLLIVMSDNGRPFHGDKQSLYDDGIKTPFIIHWPRAIKNAGVRQQLLSIVDLAPSLLELAGLPIPGSMQGLSFVTTLNSADTTIREYIFAERNWHGRNYHERAIRSLNYLYKENQFPSSGECVDSPYSYADSYKEFLHAFQEGQLEGPVVDCFAQTRAKAELMSVDSNGNALPYNLIDDISHASALNSMRETLELWRQETGDFDYTPYTHSDKK